MFGEMKREMAEIKQRIRNLEDRGLVVTGELKELDRGSSIPRHIPDPTGYPQTLNVFASGSTVKEYPVTKVIEAILKHLGLDVGTVEATASKVELVKTPKKGRK